MEQVDCSAPCQPSSASIVLRAYPGHSAEREFAAAIADLRTEHDDPVAFAGALIDLACEQLGTDGAILYWWDASAHVLTCLVSRGWHPRRTLPHILVRPGQGPVGRAFHDAVPVVVDDYDTGPGRITPGGVCSSLALPIGRNRPPVGVLHLYRHRPVPFTSAEQSQASMLAQEMTPALGTCPLRMERERRCIESDRLEELVLEGAGAGDLASAGRLITEYACALLGADWVALIARDTSGDLRAVASSGGSVECESPSEPLPCDGLLGALLESSATRFIADLDAAPQVGDSERSYYRAERLKTLLGLPLIWRGQGLGVLMLGWREHWALQPAHLDLARTIASYATTIIGNIHGQRRESELLASVASQRADLAAVIEQMPCAAIVVDTRGTPILTNRRVEMFGYAGALDAPMLAPAVDMPIRDARDRRIIEYEDLPLVRALAGRMVLNRQLIVPAPDGKERRIVMTALPRYDARGELLGAIAMYTDVTSEHDLATMEEHLRLVYQHMACGVLVLDASGQVIDANDTACEILGYDVRSITTYHTLAQHVPLGAPDGTPLALEKRPIQRALSAGNAQRAVVHSITRPDGSVRWLRIDATPVTDPSRRVRHVVATFIDITAEKRAEDLMHMIGKRYRALLEQGADTVIALDRGGVIRYISPASRHRFGYEPEEVVGKSAWTFVHPDDWVILDQFFERLLVKGGDDTTTLRVRHACSEWRIVEAAGVNLLEEPAVEGVIVTARDVTARVRAQRGQEALYETSAILAEARTLEAALARLLPALCAHLGWDVAAFWLLERAPRLLRCGAIYHRPETPVPGFALLTRDLALGPYMDLPGYALATEEAVTSHDILSDVRCQRAIPVAKEGLRGAIAVPVMANDAVQGVLELLSTAPGVPDDHAAEPLASIAAHLGAFCLRARAEGALREVQGHLHAVVRSAPIVLFALDAHGIITLSEGQGLHALGLMPGESVGRAVFDLYRDHATFPAHCQRALAGETFTSVDIFDEQALETRWAPIVNRRGYVEGTIGVSTDITAQLTLEKAEALASHSSDLGCVISREGRIVQAGASYQRLLGYPYTALYGRSFFDLIHPDDRARARTVLAAGLAAPATPVNLEVRLLHAGGNERRVELTAINHLADPTIAGLVINGRDITERRAAEEALQAEIARDPHSGLPLRAVLGTRLRAALLARQTDSAQIALAVIAPRQGRMRPSPPADVIRAVAARLQDTLRAGDTVVHLQEGVFAALLPDTDAAGSTRVAEKMLSALRMPLDDPGDATLGGSVPASARLSNRAGGPVLHVGLALAPRHAEDVEALLACARAALAAARARRWDYALYDPVRDRARLHAQARRPAL